MHVRMDFDEQGDNLLGEDLDVMDTRESFVPAGSNISNASKGRKPKSSY